MSTTTHHHDVEPSEEAFLAESRRLLGVFPVAASCFGALTMFVLCYLAVHFG